MAISVPDRSELPDDIEALKDLVVRTAQRAQIAAKDAWSTIEQLQLQLVALRRAVFGIRSERCAGQADLFAHKTELPLPEQTKQTITYERRKRRNGRPALPADLPKVRITYELDPAQRAEFASVQPIGEQISQTLEYTPARLTLIEHVRIKYRCQFDDGASTIRTASAQPSPIPKSNAGPGLLAQVLVSKFADGMPLARQERQFARHGLRLSRQTLCDWGLGAGQLLQLLRPALLAHMLGAPVIFGDDTTVRLRLAELKGRCRTARLWGYVSAGATRDADGLWHAYPKAVLYDFTEDRLGEHPQRLLARYRGYLQADDYPGYHALFRGGNVFHAACWAHARRNFFDIAKGAAAPGLAHEAIDWIGKIYEIERRIRTRDPDYRLAQRQAFTRPLLGKFAHWLRRIEPDLLPKSAMGKAVRYVLSNWRALQRFAYVGMLEADSNTVERCMRPIAVGRKAWLFLGSPRGGRAAAMALSLIESCKMAGIEPYAYLKDVLARIGSHRQDRLAQLLPFNWTALDHPGGGR